jgi:hypothetical protein
MPSGKLRRAGVFRKPILYWYTAIRIQDFDGQPLGAVMAEFGDRNALGHGAISSRNRRIVMQGESPGATSAHAADRARVPA